MRTQVLRPFIFSTFLWLGACSATECQNSNARVADHEFKSTAQFLAFEKRFKGSRFREFESFKEATFVAPHKEASSFFDYEVSVFVPERRPGTFGEGAQEFIIYLDRCGEYADHTAVDLTMSEFEELAELYRN